LTEQVRAITAQLRNFSRRRADHVRAMPLSEAVEGALLILRPVWAALPATSRWAKTRWSWPVGCGWNRFWSTCSTMPSTLSPAGPTRASSLSPRRKSRVRLRIRDNGPGISPEIAGRLFTPFATSRTMG
jgi:two-component system C4-dicarboxylate transport sensor histidine kinase DctB